MPREATGELRDLADGGHEARIRIRGKERKGFRVHAALSKVEARARCADLAKIAVRLRRVPDVDEA